MLDRFLANPRFTRFKQRLTGSNPLPLSVVALAVGSAGFAFGVYNYARYHNLTNELMALETHRIQHMNDVVFADKTAFRAGVGDAIDEIVAEKQRKEAEAKLANYDAASSDVPEGRHLYGNPQARISLVEYSDLECPFCKRFHATPKAIVDASKGTVNWEWKDYPLDMHGPVAVSEALAAHCVGEAKGNRAFWAFTHDVFAYTRTNGGGVSDLDAVISGIGADPAKVHVCMESENAREALSLSKAKGDSLGVNGTPATFVVDNVTGEHVLVAGAQPPQAILAAIQKLRQNEPSQGPTNPENPNGDESAAAPSGQPTELAAPSAATPTPPPEQP